MTVLAKAAAPAPAIAPARRADRLLARARGSSWALSALLVVPVVLAYQFMAVWNPAYGYLIKPVTLAAAVAISVVGLDIVFGIAGQLNLGHAAFFGVGAYGSAVLAHPNGALPPIAAMAVAAAIAGAVAWLLGWILLRLSGLFFAVATLGLGLISEDLVRVLTSLTGGEDGRAVGVFSVGGWRMDTPLRSYLVCFGTLLVVIAIARNLKRSARGLAWQVIAVDEDLARSQGVATERAKRQAFVLSAVLAAVGGSLFASAQQFVSHDSFNLMATIQMVTAVVVGVAGSAVGPAIAIIVLSVLPVAIGSLEGSTDLVDGALLIAVLMFLPERSRPGAHRWLRDAAATLNRRAGRLRGREAGAVDVSTAAGGEP